MVFFELLMTSIMGFIAGFYGTIVGGASLLTIPGLIFLGLSAKTSVATNRLGMLGASSTGLYKYGKEGKVNFKLGLTLAAFGLIGSLIGANILLQMEEIILKKIIGVAILLVLFILIFKRGMGVKKSDVKPSPIKKLLGHLSVFLVGIYQGFMGGGGATINSYILIFIFGQTFLESAGTRKIISVIVSITAMMVFVFAGIINYLFGITLLISAGIGSYLGAAYAIKKGEKWVKNLFIIVVAIMAIKLLFS